VHKSARKNRIDLTDNGVTNRTDIIRAHEDHGCGPMEPPHRAGQVAPPRLCCNP